LQQWLREGATVLRCTYTGYLGALKGASLAACRCAWLSPFEVLRIYRQRSRSLDHHFESLLGFRVAAILFYILKRSYSTLPRTAYFLRSSITTKYSRIPNLMTLVSFLHTAAMLVSEVLQVTTTSYL